MASSTLACSKEMLLNPIQRLTVVDGEAVPSHTTENNLIDLMEGADRLEIKVHEKGFVALVDIMPRLVKPGTTADNAIINAARVSYSAGKGKKANEDRGLIRYLSRHRHSTPTEMVELKFHCRMPIFVARQWIRHRTASVNELSGRYSPMPNDYYRPDADAVRSQSNANKQGSEGTVKSMTAAEFVDWLGHMESHHKDYERFLEGGVAREVARIGLPNSLYTEWYWKIDLHNLLHFLGLRMDSHAQQEIQDYAYPMYELIKPFVPLSVEAFDDYHPMRGAMTLTRLEVSYLRHGRPPVELVQNKREYEECVAKFARLGIKVNPMQFPFLDNVRDFMRDVLPDQSSVGGTPAGDNPANNGSGNAGAPEAVPPLGDSKVGV